jgi:hypothetical protein
MFFCARLLFLHDRILSLPRFPTSNPAAAASTGQSGRCLHDDKPLDKIFITHNMKNTTEEKAQA